MRSASAIKAAYVLGIIADVVFGLCLMAFPAFAMKAYGMQTPLSPTIHFWMAYAGCVIFVWTAFLIWAYQKPVERKLIALVTFFAVLGLALIQVFGLISHVVPLVNTIWLWALQLVLMFFFGYGYYSVKGA